MMQLLPVSRAGHRPSDVPKLLLADLSRLDAAAYSICARHSMGQHRRPLSFFLRSVRVLLWGGPRSLYGWQVILPPQ
eukprot:7049-Eustigmatos_ZCMA.PRE.1